MKKNIFIIFSVLSMSYNSYGQSRPEIDGLIDSLSWNSINITHEHPPLTPLAYFIDPIVSHLIDIGKPAAERLLQSINKSEKTVIIHMILTKLFEPEKNYFYPYLLIDNCTNKFNGLHFIFNGLCWDCISESNCNIQEYQIERITSYWDKKLHDSRNAFSINPEDLLNEIHNRDSIKYNCSDFKVYKNNSIFVDFNDIQKLFSITYPNPLFDKVFKILGNDSIYWSSGNGRYNINYIADGIEFFIDENRLSKINFKAWYEGSLFNGIKTTDDRASIIRKVGNPGEGGNKTSYYSYDWYFTKYGMYIAFGDANRVIDLQIRLNQ
jgi:hypothetical protein